MNILDLDNGDEAQDREVSAFLKDGFADESRERAETVRHGWCFGIREGGVLKAVCRGYATSDAAYVGQLMVAAAARGSGYGRALMERVASFAAAEDLRYIYVDTMSYQVPVFYGKLGYVEIGRIENYNTDHDRIFFRKDVSKT